MKKYSWIVALLAALALVLVGCGDDGGGQQGGQEGGEEGGSEPVVLFDLATYLNGVAVGADTEAEIFIDKSKIQPAGGIPAQVGIKVVDVGGEKKGLEIKTVSDWAGVDLADSGFSFKAGDTIEIAGTHKELDTQILLNTNHSGWAPAGGWNPAVTPNDTFSTTITLTAADVTAIGSATPKNIRIRTNTANAVFVIEKLIVKGIRD